MFLTFPEFKNEVIADIGNSWQAYMFTSFTNLGLRPFNAKPCYKFADGSHDIEYLYNYERGTWTIHSKSLVKTRFGRTLEDAWDNFTGS